MKVFEANISQQASGYLRENLKNIVSFSAANQALFVAFGIRDFFDDQATFNDFKEAIAVSTSVVQEPDRAEYGDFQTNEDLANKITLLLARRQITPEIALEPTCGKGSFIISLLKNIKTLKYIFGIEIYKAYVWESKFNVIHYHLQNPSNYRPEIRIIHDNVFSFDFERIKKEYGLGFKEILIIGNPPWVSNAKLSSLNSKNLPNKTNFKNHKGLDAMTGKGNFDIAEYITLSMISTFQEMKGNLALLVKNSVVKNIVLEQRINKYAISNIEKHCIDSKKEFNVSVEASMMCCELNIGTQFDCKEFDFYDGDNNACYKSFGWVDNHFVSNIDKYSHTKNIDGVSPFVWRQGLKHDCAKIMEFDKMDDCYVNGLNEEMQLEDDLVYGILKSSDLKNKAITNARKFTILTQKKVGQETQYIKYHYPKTYQYLNDHQIYFDSRKSSIYNNKPPFSIFGIGDYSFKPFKVAISGLYKTFHFTLILPVNNKPLMLDDTCYALSFDKIEFAVYTLMILNSELTKQFLQSISFIDAKRTFTKDVLMRINFYELAKHINSDYLSQDLERLNEVYNFNLTLSAWDQYIATMLPSNKHGRQLDLFPQYD
ncbi:restriction endonuclease NspV [Bacteroidales bacterium]|nr:restriction endonuclease NspV [Bacteroidales bacterium]